MKKVKRFLALFLCVIGCLSLAACGLDEEDSSESSSGVEQSSVSGDDAEEDVFG